MINTRISSSIIAGLLVFGLVVQAQETKGTPGIDYPNYVTIPKTSFSCSEQKYIPGVYADMETDCQVFHFCEESLEESFLCPIGTTFNQESLSCDFWNTSNCSLSHLFYSANSGPEFENARRNILMALKLRNRFRNRPSILPSTYVYEKITSLYDNTVGEAQSKSPDLAADVNVKSNKEISHDFSSQETPEETEESKENVSQMIKDLSGTDEGIQNDGIANRYYTGTSEVHELDDAEPNIFYDPVTEKYYLDYDSSQDVNSDLEDTVDQLSRLHYGTFGKRDGLGYDEYGDEIRSDLESEVLKERLNDLEEFSEIFGTAEQKEKEFLRRLMDVEQPVRRNRRKPLYASIQDEVAASGVERSVKYSVADSRDNRFLTDTEVSYELLPEGKMKETDSEASHESQYPNDESLNTLEEETSEFEQILSKFLSPEINGFGRYLPSEEEQSEESSDNASQVYEGDDQYSFVENVTPSDYESYSSEYNDGEFGKGPEPDQEIRGSEGTEWYQNEQPLPVQESDDTYVVIPDEYDTDVLEQYSKTNEQAENYEAEREVPDSYDVWSTRDHFLPNYVSRETYPLMGPYWFPASGYYYPYEYGRRRSFTSQNIDLLRSPEYAVSGMPNDQAYHYGFANYISPEQYPSLVDTGSYAYGPNSFAGRVYEYDAENGYSYADIYGSPYFESFETSEGADESSILSENLDTDIADNSEAEIPAWFQNDSTESSETEEEEMEGTESSVPTSRDSGDFMSQEIAGMPFDNEDMNKAETFYVFDFDEDNEEQVKADATDEESEIDMEQLGFKELFQTEEPFRTNESHEENSKNTNVLKSTETSNDEDLNQEKVLSLDGSEAVTSEESKIDSLFQTAENTGFNGSPNDLSALGNLVSMNVKAPRSNALNNLFPESDSRPKGAVVMDQQHDLEDFSLTFGIENQLLHRTGDTTLPRISKLSELQERIRSLKQGKFGAFKKYLNSPENKN